MIKRKLTILLALVVIGLAGVALPGQAHDRNIVADASDYTETNAKARNADQKEKNLRKKLKNKKKQKRKAKRNGNKKKCRNLENQIDNIERQLRRLG